MFKLGDTVFMAQYGRKEKSVLCPDCFGSKHLKVTLGDGTEIIIECGGCSAGYDPPTGYVKQYEYEISVSRHRVTGVLQRLDSVEYQLDGSSGGWLCGDEMNTFATEQEAETHGELLKVQLEIDENKRLLSKTKDRKTWAWNAYYHRKEIKRLQAQLEWHNKKVQICNKHIPDDTGAAA